MVRKWNQTIRRPSRGSHGIYDGSSVPCSDQCLLPKRDSANTRSEKQRKTAKNIGSSYYHEVLFESKLKLDNSAAAAATTAATTAELLLDQSMSRNLVKKDDGMRELQTYYSKCDTLRDKHFEYYIFLFFGGNFKKKSKRYMYFFKKKGEGMETGIYYKLISSLADP